MDDVTTLSAVLAVTRLKGEGLPTASERVSDLLEAGDAAAVWERLSAASGDLLAGQVLERSRRDVGRWSREGYRMVSVLSPAYPERLREVHQAPAIVYVEGALLSVDEAVCVVGSRRADERALAVAGRVSRALVDQGLTVVAGLARGVDAAAHAAALEAGGRTVAVMPTGLDRTYPREHAALRRRIVCGGGLVLTQFEPGATTTRASFPMRNAVMSGYGMTTFVVAADEHSGTRTQARAAVAHGRGVVLARRVAESTTWGAAMVERGQAVVADRTSDVLEEVDRLRRERAEADALFDRVWA